MSSEKHHNYFYKITNTINEKFYYGIHSTDDLDDGYMGCGRDIIKAIKKYGKENFKKEIIADYPTRKEASDKEKEVVTMELVENKMCYNLRCGGDNECAHSNETKEKLRHASLGKTGDKSSFYGKNHTDEAKEKNRQAHLGKKLTEETKRKIGDAVRGPKNFWYGKTGKDNPLTGYNHPSEFGEQISIRQQGENNSFYGKKHTNETKEWLRNNCIQGKKCSANGMIFMTIAHCAIDTGLSKSGVKYRLNSTSVKWKDWFFVTNINSETNSNTTEINISD